MDYVQNKVILETTLPLPSDRAALSTVEVICGMQAGGQTLMAVHPSPVPPTTH